MKTLLLIIVAALGISQANISLSVEDIAVQNCYVNNRANIVLFNSVTVSHPFGEQTCGELHSIEKIGLEGKESDITIKVD